MTKDLFKKALKYMLVNGEFVKLKNLATNKSEKRKIDLDYEMLTTAAEHCDIEDIPYIALLNDIRSGDVLRDALCFMAVIEAKLLGEK